MLKYTAFIIILALRISYHPADAQTTIAPFTSPSPLSTTSISITPARLISVDGHIRDNKIILDWVVGQNETADQFEVEKSMDGKNFTTAALVFGTDLPATGSYQFYEKAGNQKVSYRIKLINKDRQTAYSAVVEINPGV